MKRSLVLIAHNVRSCYNVGSLLRTAYGLGIERVYLTGYTPYPIAKYDKRLPHLREKINCQITKTALGAENNVDWHQADDLKMVIDYLRASDYQIVALEQTNKSIPLDKFEAAEKIVLIVGSEVGGLNSGELKLADEIVEIPMLGKKESFNVAISAALTLYELQK